MVRPHHGLPRAHRIGGSVRRSDKPEVVVRLHVRALCETSELENTPARQAGFDGFDSHVSYYAPVVEMAYTPVSEAGPQGNEGSSPSWSTTPGWRNGRRAGFRSRCPSDVRVRVPLQAQSSSGGTADTPSSKGGAPCGREGSIPSSSTTQSWWNWHTQQAENLRSKEH